MKRDERRIIVVLGGLPTMKARAQESERLIEWAFREFNNYKLVAAGDKVEDAEVWLGAEPKVPLTVGEGSGRDAAAQGAQGHEGNGRIRPPIPAPIEKGQTVGKIVVTAPDMPPAELPLVAAADVERMDAIGRIATLAGYMVWGGRR